MTAEQILALGGLITILGTVIEKIILAHRGTAIKKIVEVSEKLESADKKLDTVHSIVNTNYARMEGRLEVALKELSLVKTHITEQSKVAESLATAAAERLISAAAERLEQTKAERKKVEPRDTSKRTRGTD